MLTIREVMRMLRVRSRTTVYKLVEAGQIPRPIKIAPRIVRWDRESLEQHLAALGDDG